MQPECKFIALSSFVWPLIDQRIFVTGYGAIAAVVNYEHIDYWYYGVFSG